MIAHGKDIKIFSGTSNRPLAEAICKEVGTELGNAEVGAFSDGENFVSIYETAAATCSWSSPPAPRSTTTSWSCSS